MASQTNCTINGRAYYKLTKTIGRKLNDKGVEVPIKKQFYGTSKSDAEKKYLEFLEAQSKGIITDKTYFGVVAERWLQDYFLQDKSLSPQTKERYYDAWEKWFTSADFYNIELNKISPMNIQQFFNSTSAPLSSQKSILKLLRKFCKFLLQESMIARDISSSITLAKPTIEDTDKPNEIETWSKEELETIFSSFEKAQKHFRHRFVLVVCANTGMRISEVLGLKYSDFITTEQGTFIQVNRQIIRVANFSDERKHTLEVAPLKTVNAKRMIPVNSTVKKELEIHRAWHKAEMMKNSYRVDYVFSTSSGEFVDKKNLRTACDRYYKRIGVPPKGFHTFRHSFASQLSANGTPIELTAKLLGHSDISITAKYYVSIAPDRLLSVVEQIAQNY